MRESHCRKLLDFIFVKEEVGRPKYGAYEGSRVPMPNALSLEIAFQTFSILLSDSTLPWEKRILFW